MKDNVRAQEDAGGEVNTILTLILAIATIVCAFGWLINRIVAKGMILYTIEECGKAPVNGELGPYMKKAVRQMFSKKS